MAQKYGDQQYDALNDEEILNLENDENLDSSKIDINTILGPENVDIGNMQDGSLRNTKVNNTNRENNGSFEHENEWNRLKRSYDFYDQLSEKGWVKVPWEDKFLTSCFTSNDVWKKSVTTKGTASISVPKLEDESMLGVVFVSGTHKLKYSII